MKKTFEIGPGLTCDVDRLVASRLLVQANSGGGKTRTLRRLLEQSHGRLQHLVIDPEGEYHTLREKFDYVLAAPSGGDTIAHPRTAAMLAERLLQLNVSAILDIYELNPDQRVLFVQRFLDALVNAPRTLWHPVLVVLDEAHVYAPEGASNPSSTAVKAMASRGRKRGFCLVPATQRLAKLSKDVAAECNNKLIGRCTLDVDIKRAAEELGFTTNEQKHGLRTMDPGQFYAYGPAFDVKSPVLVMVGPVVSKHPEPGQAAPPVPAPTDKVKKVLQQLADLPAEAEEREKSIAELRKENAELKRSLKSSAATKNLSSEIREKVVEKIVEKPALTDADRALIEKLSARLAELEAKVVRHQESAQSALDDKLFSAFAAFIEGSRDRAVAHAEEMKAILESASVKKLLEKLNGLAIAPAPERKAVNSGFTKGPHPPARASSPVSPPATVGDTRISNPQQILLNSLAWLETVNIPRPRRGQLALVAKVSSSSSGFEKNVSTLRTLGLIEYPSEGLVALTVAGRGAAVAPDRAPSAGELHESLIGRVSRPQGELLRIAIDVHPNDISREDLAQRANVSETSSGFEKNVSTLRSLGLIDYPRQGFVKAAAVLFLEGAA